MHCVSKSVCVCAIVIQNAARPFHNLPIPPGQNDCGRRRQSVPPSALLSAPHFIKEHHWHAALGCSFLGRLLLSVKIINQTEFVSFLWKRTLEIGKEGGIKPVYVSIRYIREPRSCADARLLCCIMLRNLEGDRCLLPPSLWCAHTHAPAHARIFMDAATHQPAFPDQPAFPPAANGSRQKCCMDGLLLAWRWLSGKLPFSTDSGAATLWYNTTSQLRGPVGRQRGAGSTRREKYYPTAVIQTAGAAQRGFHIIHGPN